MVNGKVNKNLPPTANKTARIIKPKNKGILKVLDIFLEVIFAKSLSKKYKVVKINTV